MLSTVSRTALQSSTFMVYRDLVLEARSTMMRPSSSVCGFLQSIDQGLGSALRTLDAQLPLSPAMCIALSTISDSKAGRSWGYQVAGLMH